MSCEQFKPMITGYLDGELLPEQLTCIKRHLDTCENCREELAELTELKDRLAALTFEKPLGCELERYWISVYNRLEPT